MLGFQQLVASSRGRVLDRLPDCKLAVTCFMRAWGLRFAASGRTLPSIADSIITWLALLSTIKLPQVQDGPQSCGAQWSPPSIRRSLSLPRSESRCGAGARQIGQQLGGQTDSWGGVPGFRLRNKSLVEINGTEDGQLRPARPAESSAVELQFGRAGRDNLAVHWEERSRGELSV